MINKQLLNTLLNSDEDIIHEELSNNISKDLSDKWSDFFNKKISDNIQLKNIEELEQNLQKLNSIIYEAKTKNINLKINLKIIDLFTFFHFAYSKDELKKIQEIFQKNTNKQINFTTLSVDQIITAYDNIEITNLYLIFTKENLKPKDLIYYSIKNAKVNHLNFLYKNHFKTLQKHLNDKKTDCFLLIKNLFSNRSIDLGLIENLTFLQCLKNTLDKTNLTREFQEYFFKTKNKNYSFTIEEEFKFRIFFEMNIFSFTDEQDFTFIKFFSRKPNKETENTNSIVLHDIFSKTQKFSEKKSKLQI